MHPIGHGLMGISPPLWSAQLTQPGVTTTEQAAFIFSGPQFFIALIAGIVLAFGFQLLLTNLSVAAGVSILGTQFDSHRSSSSSSGGSLGSTIQKVGTAAGAWTLITVSIALFFACWLAVKLSLVTLPFLGVILGLVIWATYFTLLVWLSSTTVGSLVGSVVSAATSGFQAIFGTATAAMGARAANREIVKTVETSVAAIRRELTGSIDPETIREQLEDYLGNLRSPSLDLRGIESEFERIVNDASLADVDPNSLQKLDRQAFIDLVRSRSDVSQREAERIAAQLESAWNQAVGRVNRRPDRMGELMDYLKSARPEQLVSRELGQRLDSLIDELRLRREGSQQQQSGGVMSQGLSNAFNAMLGMAMGRADLSDFDVEKITHQIKGARDQITTQADKITSQIAGAPPEPNGIIRTDVENYLLNTYSWELTPTRVQRDFRDVLYDPNGDPTEIRRQLERISRSDFADILRSRGLFTQTEITRLTQELEQVRQEVLRDVRAKETQEKSRALQRQVTVYLQLRPKPILESNSLEDDMRSILNDPEADAETLRLRFAAIDHTLVLQTLTSRPDMMLTEAEEIATRIERTKDIVVADSESLQEGAQARIRTQWQGVEEHLRRTGKSELNPEGLKRDLRTLLDDPKTGWHDLRLRFSHFDRDTLVQLLNQRQDLNETEINQILDEVEGTWHRVRYSPQTLVATVSDQYDKATSAITDYLRNTGKEELNPEGIQRDLQMLMDDPRAGASALRDRLVRMDRDTLVQLLNQRDDLSEQEINQIIDQIQESIHNIIRAPQRLARRTQARMRDFQTAFADYLRSTEKEELNPDGIKRDLQMMLHDPRLGAQQLGERLSHIDRSTIVALLSQRNDMTEAEANRVVDQIWSVREQIVEQIRAIQYRIQGVIDGILARIRDYFNSLDRPELNYDGIKHDVRQLFDDPEAGFEALRDRLSQFDRGTLVAILSSRDDISEADANRVIDRIEQARNSVLQRAERVQREVQRRLEDVQHQAQKQLHETQKAAEAAAWWLFATALISAICAALGGGIAVIA
jgi:hypothetical protein